MVRLSINLSAALNGVTNLRPQDDEYRWNCEIQCAGCREIHDKRVDISAQDSHDLVGAQVNFLWKCKNCKRQSSANIIGHVEPVKQQLCPKWQPLVVIECRGFEITDFRPEGLWAAEGHSGTKFDNIELYDGDWYDYDEKTGQEVAITEMKWDIKRA